jgi:CopG family nickel-responsive transcriptional regulator
MVVVSISLNEKILEELDMLQDELGFSGRSEVIRAGARLLISDTKAKERLSGVINSVLLLIHDQEAENVVSKIKHKFEGITRTQIHNHLKRNKCLEIFVLDGNADDIKEMVRLFQISKKIDYVKLIIA